MPLERLHLTPITGQGPGKTLHVSHRSFPLQKRLPLGEGNRSQGQGPSSASLVPLYLCLRGPARIPQTSRGPNTPSSQKPPLPFPLGPDVESLF